MASANEALEKRKQNLINHINGADEELINTLLSVVYDHVYALDSSEPIVSEPVNVDDLPDELREQLERGLKDIEEGRTSTHEEVMQRMKEKFPFLEK